MILKKIKIIMNKIFIKNIINLKIENKELRYIKVKGEYMENNGVINVDEIIQNTKTLDGLIIIFDTKDEMIEYKRDYITDEYYFVILMNISKMMVECYSGVVLTDIKIDNVIKKWYKSDKIPDDYPIIYDRQDKKSMNEIITCFINKNKKSYVIKRSINEIIYMEHNIEGVYSIRWENYKYKFDNIMDDINLKLMKWNMFPDLNIERLMSIKCLILGMGTLGTQVVLNMLSYSIKDMILIDNSNVSKNNIMRQYLYTNKDINMNKAKAAEYALKDRNVNAIGIHYKIPMIGHINDDLKDEIIKLEKYIEKNDYVFLLTDNRESRWLPIYLCNKLKKPIFNAAIGYDRYVVSYINEVSNCYFCSDTVVPMNDENYKTLDMQCSVTKPGVSTLASTMLVELFIDVIHNKNKYTQIRGSMSGEYVGSNLIKNKGCICCSDIKNDILDIFKDPNILNKMGDDNINAIEF